MKKLGSKKHKITLNIRFSIEEVVFKSWILIYTVATLWS